MGHNKIRKWIKRKAGNRSLRQLKINFKRKIFKRRYSTHDIIMLMKSMGLKKGSTIFVHSSWDEFYNYTGSIREFIDAILIEIGPEGTLAMPAYRFLDPHDVMLKNRDYVFRIGRTPTTAGLIAESFRRYPGVKRSANRHSVCALGPNSSYLVDEHLFSTTCWDEKSPYYKLAELNALVFSFGLGKYFTGTITHCVESILKDELPYFALFFGKKNIYKIELEDKTIYNQVSYERDDKFIRYSTKSSKRKFMKYFDKTKYARKKISNLTVNMYEANYYIHKSIDLARKGIVKYKKPIPSKDLFQTNE